METALSRSSIENRRSERVLIRVPVKLEVIENANVAAQMFLGYTANINRHGLLLDIGANTPILKDSEVTIHLDSIHPHLPLKMNAKLLWHANSQCGLQFNEEVREIQNLLSQISHSFEVSTPFLRKFYPYVDGEDVDTHKYEFFPYADKALTDYRKIRESIIQLKRGIYPADSESQFYAQYAIADSNLNKAAILSAHKAFQEFRKFSIERRKKILSDIRELLIKEKENFIDLLVIEGHPRKVAEWEYSGMLAAHCEESLNYFASELMKTVGQNGDETILLVRRPEGVICVSPPRNAASSVSLMATFALLAGNTIVVKPPLQMPISAIYVWRNIVGRALNANQAPKGTVNIVMGNSKQFMDDWMNSPYVRCIFFFGDSETGLEIGKKIYEKGKKPILELAGNDFMVIWKDAPLEDSTDSLLDAFMGSTQICMVPKKALIHEDIYPEFVSLFLQKVKKLKVGLPSDTETILSPVTKITKYFEHLDDALQKGANVLTGGYRINHLGERDENGFFIAPTVLSVSVEQAQTMKCVNEENFFPLIPLIRVKGDGFSGKEKDDLIYRQTTRLLDENEYGLRVSVWVRNPYYLRKFIDDVHHSGLLRINSRHIGFSPFLVNNGGVGRSGGPYGEMNFVWQKTCHLQGVSVTRLDIDSHNSM